MSSTTRPTRATARSVETNNLDDSPTSLANDRVPTLIYAMQNDTLVPPSRLTTLYNSVPAPTEKAYIEITGAGHNYIGQPSTVIARTTIPWLKIFVDGDTRYSQFLCPSTNLAGIRQYRSTCPLI